MKIEKRNDDDLLIYENEIRPYLPEKIFDAHSHLCKTELHDYQPNPNSTESFFYDVGMQDLESNWNSYFPDSDVNGLVMGTPVYGCNYEAENHFVAESITDKNNRFSIMTT